MTTSQCTKPLGAYDPAYDPLVAKIPGKGLDYAPTYWVASAGEAPADDGPITADTDAEMVIVGSGFTGLNAAIFLAEEYGIRATVLEANRSAWGCSTRNGGQAQCASGRLKRSQWISRWGLDTAKAMHQECLDGMEYFKHVTKDIDCDAQPGGHLYIAHKARVMPVLEKEAALLRDTFGYDAQILDKATVQNEWVGDQEAHGAMHEPEGIGIHAGKLAFGYINKARALGVKIHPASPVQDIERRDGYYYLRTPNGTVRTKTVGLATGGYTSNHLHRSLKNRLFPILSNSITTAPLTPEQIEACSFHTNQVLTDTRILRHYYRLLPDNRVQIGSRSAVTGRSAPRKKYEDFLIRDLHKKFPALEGIDIDYSWWGWVDVSHDMMPRIFQPNAKEPLFYAMGYGGNGVMYSAQAGRRLAQWMTGNQADIPDLPIFQDDLPFPNVRELLVSEVFAPFRRLGQTGLYRWYWLKDEVL